MDKKLKHLEMIECVIERMGSNSFKLKGWAVTLLTILGALTVKETDKSFMLWLSIPLVAFWFLDAYYLQVERKYKKLYTIIAAKDESQIDFNMSTEIIKHECNLSYFNCFMSKTEIIFYGVLILVVIFAMCTLNVLP